MARIELQGLAHAYVPEPSPEDYVLHDVDLTWEDGVSYALLGPSGCGKTTLLNILSGLLRPSQGRILFDGVDVTERDPRGRNIAQVFQFPVIYDSMTVRGNLAFPLRNRGWRRPDIDRRVAEVAEALDLGDLLDRRAVGLSADRKQVISLARGLVRPDVAAILFDEPLTVIDPHRKWELRCQLRRIYERFRLTLIYVTHDQTEALTFADQVLVMKDGAILQQGSPEELYDAPQHAFVGHFIGSPGMNFLPCDWRDGGLHCNGLALPMPCHLDGREPPAGELRYGIRPAHLAFCSADDPLALPVTVDRVRDLGNFGLVECRLGEQRLIGKIDEDDRLDTGPGHCRFPPEHAHLYADGRRV